MNTYKNYLKTIIKFFITLLIYISIVSIFNYFSIFSYNFTLIINYIFLLLLFGYTGYKISKLQKNKGYLNGFLISLVIVLLFCFIGAFHSHLTYTSLVYYLSLMVCSIIGGIIGVPNEKE